MRTEAQCMPSACSHLGRLMPCLRPRPLACCTPANNAAATHTSNPHARMMLSRAAAGLGAAVFRRFPPPLAAAVTA